MKPRHLLLAAAAGIAACSENPAELRRQGEAFPVIATWTAAVGPVGSSAVTGSLSVQQHRGFRMNAALTLTDTTSTDTQSTRYQWRIFRGDCATNTPAVNSPNAPSPTGLLLFATVQSYPDVTVDYVAGTGSAAPVIAGNLDSLTAYSIRIRLFQTANRLRPTPKCGCALQERRLDASPGSSVPTPRSSTVPWLRGARTPWR